jgi:outer membrane lipoprotein SlyB
MRSSKSILLLALLLLYSLAPPAFAWDRCNSCGVVSGIEKIRDRDHHFGGGTAIGAIAGGLLGSTIGRGNGRTAAVIGGAVVGGAVGHQVEKNNRNDNSFWRFHVRLDNGRRVTIDQGDNPGIRNGDEVRVDGNHVERR